MEEAQHRQCLADRALGIPRRVCEVIEPASAVVVQEQVHITAAESGGPEGRYDRHMVRRVVNGLEAIQQVAGFLRLKYQGSALETEGYVASLQAPLKAGKAGAPRHQDADVRVPGWAIDLFIALSSGLFVQHRPLTGHDLVEQGGNFNRFLLADRTDGFAGRVIGQRPYLRAVRAAGVALPAGIHFLIASLLVTKVVVPGLIILHPLVE